MGYMCHVLCGHQEVLQDNTAPPDKGRHMLAMQTHNLIG